MLAVAPAAAEAGAVAPQAGPAANPYRPAYVADPAPSPVVYYAPRPAVYGDGSLRPAYAEAPAPHMTIVVRNGITYRVYAP